MPSHAHNTWDAACLNQTHNTDPMYKYNFVWSLFVKKVKYVCNFSGILWSRRRAIYGKYSCGRILGSVWLSSSIYGSLGNNQSKPDLWFPICTGDNKIPGKWWPIVVPLSTWYIKWGLRNKNYLINTVIVQENTHYRLSKSHSLTVRYS